MMHIYTDGACSHNGTWQGGWGVVVVKNDEVLHTFGGTQEKTTNNQMEMKAVIEAMRYAKEQGSFSTIYTDSAYVHNAFSQGWITNWQRNGWVNSKKQPVKNQELWQEMISLGTPNLVKVKGHATDKYNNMADAIAVQWRDKV